MDRNYKGWHEKITKIVSLRTIKITNFSPVDCNFRVLYRNNEQPTCGVPSAVRLFAEVSVGGLFVWFSEGSRNCSFTVSIHYTNLEAMFEIV